MFGSDFVMDASLFKLKIFCTKCAVTVNDQMWKVVIFVVILLGFNSNRCQFFQCHGDPYTPEEGPLQDMQFTWLGVLQYIHIKNGTPHYFRVPRVVLITRQFVLSTAVDAAQIPDGYALGNVAFSEYERDEEECGMSVESIAAGKECESAALLVPLSDVLLHPEYKHFGITESIAILKLLTPIKSHYMVPACLPFKNFLVTRSGRRTRDKFYHVDFTNDVPRDLMEEEKEITKLTLLPKELCYLYGAASSQNITVPKKSSIMCTTGCGFHSGAPSMVHEHTGHWSIVSLSQGGSPCPDPLRSRRPPPPPRHILIHPYVPWITSAISGKAVGAYAKDDPFGFVLPRALPDYDLFGHEWNGHWWMGGLACYSRGESADMMFKFYHEMFQVKPPGKTLLTYYLELNAVPGTSILCIKVGMPYRLAKPRVWDLNSPEAKVRIPVLRFDKTYRFTVEAWGYNTSEEYDESDTSSSSDYSYYG